CLFFFFFQAEDGIRDGHVTGVQTCALPISKFEVDIGITIEGAEKEYEYLVKYAFDRDPDVYLKLGTLYKDSGRKRDALRVLAKRSEERRVGKECRHRRRT